MPPVRRSHRVGVWLVLLLVVASGSSLARQDRPRARIGLALGGGAARGFAHIGVLRWLHEHRVPIDVVGGTSMGGLVAGAFATGMSPEEIEALVASLDWGTILAPDSPFTDKTFRRKQDARAFPSMLEFGLRGGPRLPTGLSPAAQVNLLFDRLALPYYRLAQFDDLPTPLRCVAVDLRRSDVVVFDSGPLQEALRATMAIPGVFTPVTMGDRVLVDGGVLNNVPADIVARMGADVVIAVDVSADLSSEKTSDSIFSVLGETLDVMMRAATRRALASATHVIAPHLEGLNASDFSRVAEFIARGYAAADASRGMLEQYSVSNDDYRAYLEWRRSRRRSAAPAPAVLTVEGVKGHLATVVHRRLRPYLGRPVVARALERELLLLVGSERFDAISYRLADSNGQTSLVVTARAKAHAPPYLLGALDLQNVESPGVVATLRGRIVYLDFLASGSELRLDASLGSTTHLGAEYYLALGRSGLFLSPLVSYERSSSSLYAGDSLVAQYRNVTRDAGADIGVTTGWRFEARAGYFYSHRLTDMSIGDPVLPVIDGPQRYWRLRAAFDGQDGAILPRRGLRLEGEARRFLQTAPSRPTSDGIVFRDPNRLAQARADGSYFHPVGQAGRVFVNAGAGSSLGDTARVNTFTLGGPFRLGAFENDELRGSNYVVGAAGYFHELARVFEGALGRVYLGGWIESGATFEDLRAATPSINVSGGLIMQTPLGPAFLVASAGKDGAHRFYIGIGPLFDK
ncbi:MAG: patatin-like phospholipase family protein [Acidobacteriota bacterium]